MEVHPIICLRFKLVLPKVELNHHFFLVVLNCSIHDRHIDKVWWLVEGGSVEDSGRRVEEDAKHVGLLMEFFGWCKKRSVPSHYRKDSRWAEADERQ